MNYNKVIIGGRLTRDAELKFSANGMKITEFSIASTHKYGKNEETLFLDFTFFGDRGETILPYLTKGKAILVEGRLKLDRWEKNGVQQSKIVGVAEDIVFVNSGKREE